MSSPGKHKSSHNHHHHHHHHHREHHHSSNSSYSSSSTVKPITNLSSYIKIQDNSKVLPRYSVALSKPHDECLPMEELDASTLQLELETLLSAVALRYRALKSEHDYLEDRKHQKKGSDKEKASSPSTSGKRKREEKKSTSKDTNRYSQHTKHPKIKSSSIVHTQHTEHSSNIDVVPYSNTDVGHSHTNPKLTLPKNDAVNKFWLSVEPYCMPITQEDIKLLDDMLDEYTEPIVPPIPELGPHYTVRWAADDLHEEQETSSTNVKICKRPTPNPTDAKDSSSKENEKMDQGICGPLTQRLISALLEENNEIQSDIGASESVQGSNDICTENNPLTANQSSSIVSQLKSGIDVEKRLKKELLDLGILEASDFAKDKEDEVLNEIKRVRTELQAIAEYNCDELKLLRSAAKEEMKRLEVKRKLDRIDQVIIEAYRRVFAAKQKRRPLTKHERNEIYRLVNEQKRLSDQLEAMPIPGFNFTVAATDESTLTESESASNTTKA